MQGMERLQRKAFGNPAGVARRYYVPRAV